MSFIDGSYFIGENLIPNIEAPNDVAINQAIEQYEKEVLLKLLGYSLFKAMNADLDGSGNPQEQRFVDLVDGSEFQHTDGFAQTLKWEGFRNDQKLSLCADYVFYEYIKRTAQKISGVGNVDIKAENAQKVSPVQKLSSAWYRMRELYGIVPPHIKWRNPVKGSDLSCVFDSRPSAYNFLFANKENYPEWVFTPIRANGVNILGV